jgi:signal transduction histidine kinase
MMVRSDDAISNLEQHGRVRGARLAASNPGAPVTDPRATLIRGRARDVATLAVIAAVYFGVAKIGLSFATKHATAVWPPTGVAVVGLLLFGYRVWPGILIGAFAANAANGLPIAVAAGISIGNTLGPLVGVHLLRRVVRFDNAFARLWDVTGLLLGAAVTAIVTASNGVGNLVLGGILPSSAYGSAWWVWWVGDAMGVLLVAPVLLSWAADRSLAWRGWRGLEVVVLFATLVVVSRLIFEGPPELQLQNAVFPFILWCALRFGVRETATAAVLISGIAVWGAIHGRGPFALGVLDDRLVLLEAFMVIAAIGPLSLSVATSERRRAEAALHRAHDELELRVQDRTAELAAANTELAGKNAEVEAFVYIVSHDLRAPLVNLQGFAKELELGFGELSEKLRDAPLPANVQRDVESIVQDGMGGALRFIRASTIKFERLIEALLRLSRHGRERYVAEVVDVGAVVEVTLASLRQSVEARGAMISIAGALPNALGDATAIGQVFSNLIDNALNYLKPGTPGIIEIGGQTSGSMAQYWVRDNGVGISASAQPRLFQVFQRLHPHMAPGEGMGLAIVKRVVERHGGQVRVQSDENAGATFHVTLPAADGTNAIVDGTGTSRHAPHRMSTASEKQA